MKMLIVATLTVFVSLTQAEEITGPVHVIDGDSVRIADTEIRLHGIDAPEGKQTCLYRGDDWSCGKTATDALKQFAGTELIRCTWTERDRFERALATCHQDEYDLAGLMVDNGLALAYRKYSEKYVQNETNARSTRKGLWSAQFIAPWDWRRGVRLPGNELPDIDCPVKGNVNSKGDRIYHVKGWRDHPKVRINKDEGDRCFRTVEDALRAGFRPPQYARGK